MSYQIKGACPGGEMGRCCLTVVPTDDGYLVAKMKTCNAKSTKQVFASINDGTNWWVHIAPKSFPGACLAPMKSGSPIVGTKAIGSKEKCLSLMVFQDVNAHPKDPSLSE